MFGVKIYEMNDFYWVAARSIKEATTFFRESIEPREIIYPFELSKHAMKTLKYRHESLGFNVSFRCMLAIKLASGFRPPFLFGASEN